MSAHCSHVSSFCSTDDWQSQLWTGMSSKLGVCGHGHRSHAAGLACCFFCEEGRDGLIHSSLNALSANVGWSSPAVERCSFSCSRGDSFTWIFSPFWGGLERGRCGGPGCWLVPQAQDPQRPLLPLLGICFLWWLSGAVKPAAFGMNLNFDLLLWSSF